MVQKDFEKNLWIPYTNLFPKDSLHKVVRGTLENVFNDHILLSANEPLSEITLGADQDHDRRRINFDYLVIATGSMIPAPAKWKVNNSADALELLDKTRQDIERSERIVIVGGGACGCEHAGELRYRYPNKSVTLIHEGPSLVDYAHYPQSFKDEARRYLEKQGVEVILNERAEIEGLSRENAIQRAERTIKLKHSDRTFQSDLQFFSIGMSVDTSFMSTLHPVIPSNSEGDNGFDAKSMLDSKTKAILVKPTLQLDNDAFSNIFAIGDVSKADPVPTGQAAISEGEVAARNIVKLIHRDRNLAKDKKSDDETDGFMCPSWKKLEEYSHTRPLMVLAMNPKGGVTHLPILGTWFGGLGAWLVKSGDLFSGRFWHEMNMPRP
ncbi:Apoptosis-inducing factor 2 [Mortierella claussenii]|nr:Apoptosis-inducing factor 2 [Mortierella claussenii]